MSFKKLGLGILVFGLMSPVALTGCTSEKTETEIHHDSAPVVVPDTKDQVDVNVHTDTQPAPNVIEKNTNTNTTIDNGVKSETKTESTTVH